MARVCAAKTSFVEGALLRTSAYAVAAASWKLRSAPSSAPDQVNVCGGELVTVTATPIVSVADARTEVEGFSGLPAVVISATLKFALALAVPPLQAKAAVT